VAPRRRSRRDDPADAHERPIDVAEDVLTAPGGIGNERAGCMVKRTIGMVLDAHGADRNGGAPRRTESGAVALPERQWCLEAWRALYNLTDYDVAIVVDASRQRRGLVWLTKS
jgi:hypothetical protein